MGSPPLRAPQQNWTFNKALKPSDQSKKTQKCKPLTNKNKANITIPYVQGVSEKLRRIFQNFNIATNFKPHSTLRQRLVHPKDRPHKGTKANVIYRLKCEEPNCNNTYIGETSRPLKVRYKEHCRPSANGYSSAIFHHLQHNQEFKEGQQRVDVHVEQIHAARFSDIEYVYRTPHQSLADRMQLPRGGDMTWEKTIDGLTTVNHMSKAELVRELVSRCMLDTDEAKAKTSKELQALMKTQLHGVKRQPVLLFGSTDTPLQNVNLDKYLNLDRSYPAGRFMMSPTIFRISLKSCPSMSFLTSNKSACLTSPLKKDVNVKYFASTIKHFSLPCACLLGKRAWEPRHTSRMVPRLLRQVIPKPKKLTSPALYGSNVHALTCHSPLTLTGSEKRVFNRLRGIHRTAGSARHPGQVIGNMLVRAHCEIIIRGDKDAMAYQPTIVSNAAKAKERDGRVVDCDRGWGEIHPDSLPAGPVMMHFRSSSLKSVESHLKKTWQQCLNEDIVIQLEKVYRNDENGDLQSITRIEFLGTSQVDVCEDSIEYH
ncbi:hypothetical protein Bbelb_024690 [Branchiostoma belcheri]|nr:hypothetical protein Bbelb_024690 [Branchiostoma belcheri]